MRLLSLAAALGLVATQAGCLTLRLVDASVRKPSNVAVYFSVTDASRHPVASMTADQFRIYEDGKVVSLFESRQTILNPEVAVAQDTLLLMDMSGSVTESGRIADLLEAASAFTDRIGKTQVVGVATFDGSKDIHMVSGFAAGGGNVRSSLSGLASYKPKDPSTNLNGAVIEGLHALQAQMARSTQPLRIGNLVVFTDGTDHAHRVSRADLQKALDGLDDSVNVFVIGVGAEIDSGELHSIGRTKAVLSRDPAKVRQAFDDVAKIVEDYGRSFYLLSYCSPARAGEHDVEVEARPPHRGSGRLIYHFNAAGFGPQCDPNQTPSFDVHHPRTTGR